MKWFSERLSALNDVAGLRRYILASVVSFGIVVFAAIANTATGYGLPHIGVPNWVFAAFLVLAFTWWWMLEYIVGVRRRLKGARLALATLRREGVELRNEGRHKISTDAAWRVWEGKALDWTRRVIESLKGISEGDAEWFSILDVVPNPRLTLDTKIERDPDGANDHTRYAHQKLYGEHDFRLMRLGDMIQRLWGNEFMGGH